MTSLGVGSTDIAACSACPITHYLAPQGSDFVCVLCAPHSIPTGTGLCGCESGTKKQDSCFRAAQTEKDSSREETGTEQNVYWVCVRVVLCALRLVCVLCVSVCVCVSVWCVCVYVFMC